MASEIVLAEFFALISKDMRHQGGLNFASMAEIFTGPCSLGEMEDFSSCLSAAGTKSCPQRTRRPIWSRAARTTCYEVMPEDRET